MQCWTLYCVWVYFNTVHLEALLALFTQCERDLNSIWHLKGGDAQIKFTSLL